MKLLTAEDKKRAEIRRMAKRGYVPQEHTKFVHLERERDIEVLDVRHKLSETNRERYMVIRASATDSSQSAVIFLSPETAEQLAGFIKSALAQRPEAAR